MPASNEKVVPQDFELRYLKGIGPKRAQALAKLGIYSKRDLRYFFPRRYEDRTKFCSIAEARIGETLSLSGEILDVRVRPIKRMRIIQVTLGDDSGIIYAVWFNQFYLKSQFSVGQKLIVYGKIDFYQNRLQISSPEFEIIDPESSPEEDSAHFGRITPIYPLTEGLYQRSLRSTMYHFITQSPDAETQEFIPDEFKLRHQFMDLPEAVREMHFPSDETRLEKARQRIVFDEFLVFQYLLLKKMEKYKSRYQSCPLEDKEDWMKQYISMLPFELTPGQTRSMEDLRKDMSSVTPMNRLLHGDVGAGKTVVAGFGCLLAAKNGYQAAVLVPTEILAEQHYQSLRKFLEPFQINIGLMTSSTSKEKRAKMIGELKAGKLSLLIGTHAILQEDVQFKKLALVMVDEQHKFGVRQRCQLLEANPRPHHLVMTATPIPRTLALTIYGDLQVSVLNELPKGRQPIKTYWITRSKQTAVLNHLAEKLKKGEQAYFIFPLIEETEKKDLLAAKKEYERLRKGALKNFKVGLIHGRLDQSERDLMMKQFRAGEIQALVATSVIEVGVDNPNATVMVIENAERFGLSQLHQMRGRIGRGSKASECFLFGEPNTSEGQRRLRIMTKTQDGFMIAEEDLKLRGPGDFFGTRQSGIPFFHIADPVRDYALLLLARQTAQELLHKNLADSSENWHNLSTYMNELTIQY